MLSPEAHEILKDLLELFSQASDLPIAVYEVGLDGRTIQIARSGDEFFPRHCHAVWKLDEGAGRRACDENMCARARTGFDSICQNNLLCHAGLTVKTDPIRVNGETVAVIVSEGPILFAESDPQLSMAQHDQAMKVLKATKEQAAKIRELLLDESRQGDDANWDWVRKTLTPIFGRLIEKYTSYEERERRIMRSAYHDVQLRLQSALSLSENLSRHFKKEPHADLKRIEEMDYLTGAIEAAGTVMHNSSRGQYLPEKYRFSYHPIQNFIDSAVMMCRQEAREREIEFKIELVPEGGQVRIPASDLHLQQAFNNLFQNAVKYSYRRPHVKRGEIVRPWRFITVRGAPHRDHGESGYRVSIGNYGVGIEPDEMEKIFQEGYQGRLTKAEYRTGSGQGLDLTKRIIGRHNGTITVHSEPRGDQGEGGSRPYQTVFTVWLPFKQPMG
jgi:signal transduction histidine kinase